MNEKDMKWNISEDSLPKAECRKMQSAYKVAESQMRARTKNHELYGLLAKNKNIHEFRSGRKNGKYFSEGSTQYIMRKVLADTIQRVPDGELETPYDKASPEHILTEYLFENKVMWSEFNGIDMMSNLTNTFKMSFIYAFAPVRTGFEKDYDDDARISYNLEHWADVYVNPDCKDIRNPQVVYFRQYMSKAEVEALLTEEGTLRDSTYEENTVKYILDHDMFSAKRWESEKLADKAKGGTALESLELITEYRKGAKEFVTFAPALKAVFRKVPNYDPRKDIPWNFFVLEPDPDFPLGISQVEFLLADQQFNDLFQTSAYKNLLLAMEPPIMVSGWETNPASYRFEPRKIWNLGNNPNQVKVEPVKIDNSVLSGWSQTREAVSAAMLRNLNVADGTVAADAHAGYSKTAPGVNEQKNQKTITINQYQKRIEHFIADWANQALRSYIASMHGEHRLTVDEKTRRKLFDIGREDLIDGNQVIVDFDMLGTDLLAFKVREGSLVLKKEEKEREALNEMVQPFIQNLNGWSEENRPVIENEVILPIAKRLLELADADISQTLADALGGQIAKQMMQNMQQQVDQQGQQLQMQQQQIDDMQMQQQQPMPDAAEQAPMPSETMPAEAQPEQPPFLDAPIESAMPPEGMTPADLMQM